MIDAMARLLALLALLQDTKVVAKEKLNSRHVK